MLTHQGYIHYELSPENWTQIHPRQKQVADFKESKASSTAGNRPGFKSCLHPFLTARP